MLFEVLLHKVYGVDRCELTETQNFLKENEVLTGCELFSNTIQ